jgi:hypothetical protein
MDFDLLRAMLPDHVLTSQVFTYFGFKDYALASCASQYLQAHWQTANERKPMPLYVPEDCRTLEDAVERVQQDRRITTIILGKGEHHIEGRKPLRISFAMNIVGRPDVPKEKIVVFGGFYFNKGIQGNCHLQHMIIRQTHFGCENEGWWKVTGVTVCSHVTMEDIIVEQCGECGVRVHGTGGVGIGTDLEVHHCRAHGVCTSEGGSMTLIGAKTTVHHNCRYGDEHYYGLCVEDNWGAIQLVSPLTKEKVSIDNGGGGNWGWGWNSEWMDSTESMKIKIIGIGYKSTHRDLFPALSSEPLLEKQILRYFGYKEYASIRRVCTRVVFLWEEAIEERCLPLYVPEDCLTLNEAIQRLEDDCVSATIVLGKGNHIIEENARGDNEVCITFPMSIVGRPDVAKEEIVILGGIKIELQGNCHLLLEEVVQGNCHLQHMTLRQAKGDGVYAQSSFTMEDVLVEKCGRYGVYANGPYEIPYTFPSLYGTVTHTGVEAVEDTGVGRCTNVEVRHCAWGGVGAGHGGSVTLIGTKTTVHHNCTNGESRACGLSVFDSSSSAIQLVSPLTKEIVSIDNAGEGGNWGAYNGGDINQIKAIDAAGETNLNPTVQVFPVGPVLVRGYNLYLPSRFLECKEVRFKKLLKQGRVNEVAQEAWKGFESAISEKCGYCYCMMHKEITNAIVTIDLSGDPAWLNPAIWLGNCSLDSWCGLQFTKSIARGEYDFSDDIVYCALYVVHPTDGTRKQVAKGEYEYEEW